MRRFDETLAVGVGKIEEVERHPLWLSFFPQTVWFSYTTQAGPAELYHSTVPYHHPPRKCTSKSRWWYCGVGGHGGKVAESVRLCLVLVNPRTRPESHGFVMYLLCCVRRADINAVGRGNGQRESERGSVEMIFGMGWPPSGWVENKWKWCVSLLPQFSVIVVAAFVEWRTTKLLNQQNGREIECAGESWLSFPLSFADSRRCGWSIINVEKFSVRNRLLYMHSTHRNGGQRRFISRRKINQNLKSEFWLICWMNILNPHWSTRTNI